MNKRGGNREGSGKDRKVYGGTDTAEVANMTVTGSGGGDLLGKRDGRVKDEAEIFSAGSW